MNEHIAEQAKELAKNRVWNVVAYDNKQRVVYQDFIVHVSADDAIKTVRHDLLRKEIEFNRITGMLA